MSGSIDRRALLAMLDDDALIRGMSRSVQAEFDALVEVLDHFIEFDRRRIYVGLGFSSLFAYATVRLRYSEGSAQRRISAARAIRDFPIVREAFLLRRVHLTAVALLSSVFTPENAAELVARAEGKTQDQVKAIVASLRPGGATRDRIVPQGILGPPQAAAPGPSLHAPVPAEVAGAADPPETPPDRPPPPVREVLERFQFVFSASPAFKEKFERARTLLSGKFPAGAPFEAVFEVMMDEFLERHSPERRAARRAERDGTCEPPAPAPAGTRRSRRIPAALEDEIWIRDGGRCTYVAPDGTRCASTWDLEIHHEEPFARNGKTDAKTCRLRCQVHNLYAARQDFGDEHVDRAIECRRRGRQVDMLADLDERSD